MRCRPGDLAVIVVGSPNPRWAGWLGRVVTVIRVAAPMPWDPEPAWVCDPMPPGAVAIKDYALRPIRDNDAPDETLAWAGKPEEVAA